jgi:negative regulator of sigma E activity
MNEELDSQLSAMFDDELHSAECELLARRLSRDEALKARWGRYAVIGAVIRAERGVRLNASLAGRVSAVLVAEPALEAQPPRALGAGRMRWWQPLAAGGLAAGVAAVSVLWLRAQAPLQAAAPLTAQAVPAAARALAAPQVSYVVPPPPPAAPPMVPTTELANYVVAHSMFSTPVAGRNMLSAFMTSEGGANVEEPVEDAKSSGK